MKKHFLLFVLMLLPLAVSADDSGKCGSNVYYSYNAGTHTLTISGTGEMSKLNYYEDEWGDIYTEEIPWYSHVSEIQSVNIEYGVTSISRYAFINCSGLRSVTIPNSVTSIGYAAFQNCSGLTSVTIPNSVTSIGDFAFQNCSGLTSISIPNSVNSIGWSVFGHCSGLTSVTIPNSVTSIGDGAFSGCSGLTSVTIPSSVTSIGTHAFSGCSGLTSVTIPSSVTSIGNYAFQDCSGLTSITIPNSVTTIGGWAFSSCGLTSITIPNSVTAIGNGAFGACSDLTSIQVESGNQYYDSRNNCNAIIDNNNQLIVGCKNTIIPNSVTSIGSHAFYSCSGLTTITIPNSVTSIGDDAFYGCAGMVYVTLPSNLTSIGNYAFLYCYSLTDIYCKAVNVPSTNSYAFSNPENIILHVPSESLNAYQTADPWKWYKFKNYVSLSSSDIQASAKCSKPTISIVDRVFVFNCETSNVNYNWSISTPNGTNGRYGSSVSLPITLNVFATKSGYMPSDVATYEFSGLVGDVNNDGKVDVADHVKLSEIIMDQK